MEGRLASALMDRGNFFVHHRGTETQREKTKNWSPNEEGNGLVFFEITEGTEVTEKTLFASSRCASIPVRLLITKGLLEVAGEAQRHRQKKQRTGARRRKKTASSLFEITEGTETTEKTLFALLEVCRFGAACGRRPLITGDVIEVTGELEGRLASALIDRGNFGTENSPPRRSDAEGKAKKKPESAEVAESAEMTSRGFLRRQRPLKTMNLIEVTGETQKHRGTNKKEGRQESCRRGLFPYVFRAQSAGSPAHQSAAILLPMRSSVSRCLCGNFTQVLCVYWPLSAAAPESTYFEESK